MACSVTTARSVIVLAVAISLGGPSPDCWDGEISESLCCNERWGLVGNAPCWDSQFTYLKCCGLAAFPRRPDDDVAWDKERSLLPSSDADEFDFIVVGAGSAGSTLAARLAAAEGPDGQPWRVLLIEEGPPERPETMADPDRLPDNKELWREPLNASWKLDGVERIWPYTTGQGLGGSARVNSMIYMRGSLDEYAHFGWNVSEVLSAFKALEAPMEVPGFAVDETFHQPFSSEQSLEGAEISSYHLTLVSATYDELPRVFRALISAFEDEGVPFRLDPHSSRSMHGIGGTWRSMGCGHARCQPSRVPRFRHAKGRPRSSTYSSLTAPTLARGRQRLRVLTNAKAERVVFDEERRAIGVQVLMLPSNGEEDGDLVAADSAAKPSLAKVPRPRRVFHGSSAEVIVAAGVFGSPKLLTLSGVAEPEELKRLGIPLVAGIPEVGRHLHEHVGLSIVARTMVPCPEGYHKVDGTDTHLGHLDDFIGQLYAFMNVTHERPGAPGSLDAEIMILEGCVDGALSFTFTVMLLQSLTRGRIVVQSRSPHTPPHVDYHPLSFSEDIDRLAAIVRRIYAKVLAAPVLAEFGLTVIPTAEVISDAHALMYWMRHSLWYYGHPGGTCRVDRAGYPGVVDSQFRVLGTRGLRVADASVFPVSPSGHSDGPSRLSGELAARAVLRHWEDGNGAPSEELEEKVEHGLSVRLRGYPNVRMPLVGFGTAGFTGEPLMISLSHFLRLGGRLIDTASLYQNHKDVAAAIKTSGLPRREIFIVSKIPPHDMGREATAAAIERIVGELGTYVDLLLIHWPAHFQADAKLPSCAHGPDGSWRRCRADTWQAMEAAHRAGWVQALGVSNFGKRHLSELLDEPDRTLPVAANEIEFHPWWPQLPLVKFCKARHVQLVAYGSMGSSLLGNAMLKAPDVVRVAEASGKSTAQVLLRWAVQQGIAVIPASSSPKHIAENLDLASWELSDAAMGLLRSVPTQGHMRVYQPDPEAAP